MNTLEKFEKGHLKELQSDNKLPKFSSGDTIKVHLKVKEGEKERIQVFEGVCISKKNAGLNSSFTVRKISYGEGIERILPLFSPQINKIATKINEELEKKNNISDKQQSNLNKVPDDNKSTKDIVNEANISVEEKEKVDEKK